MTLSDHIQGINDFEIERYVHPACMTEIIEVKDVKEFIRLLKDQYMKYRNSFKTLEDYYRIFDDIDKLAGKKLI